MTAGSTLIQGIGSTCWEKKTSQHRKEAPIDFLFTVALALVTRDSTDPRHGLAFNGLGIGLKRVRPMTNLETQLRPPNQDSQFHFDQPAMNLTTAAREEAQRMPPTTGIEPFIRSLYYLGRDHRNRVVDKNALLPQLFIFFFGNLHHGQARRLKLDWLI